MDSSTRDCGDEDSSRASSSTNGRQATRELFLCSTATVRKRYESDDDFLARVTHLRLQNKGISSLGNTNAFKSCPALKVLYLYDNYVETLKGLERLSQLQQLHAENNLLTSVEFTLPCRRLTKLNLSGNSIATLCGLETARCLEELYVARQLRNPENPFKIDAASIDGIKDSLVVLDASSNGMGRKEIEAVLDLYRLEVLNLGGNDIDEMAQVVDLVTTLEALTECDLRGNAVSRMPKYFERAVTRCGDKLSMLDGKPVHPQHRSMLQSLDRHKRAEARKVAARKVASPAHPAPIAEPRIPAEAWGNVEKGSASTMLGHYPGQQEAGRRDSQSASDGARLGVGESERSLVSRPNQR